MMSGFEIASIILGMKRGGGGGQSQPPNNALHTAPPSHYTACPVPQRQAESHVLHISLSRAGGVITTMWAWVKHSRSCCTIARRLAVYSARGTP